MAKRVKTGTSTKRLESSIVNGMVNWIKRELPKSVAIKLHGSPLQRAGLPDILLLMWGLPRGEVIWIEVKRPGEEPTPLQRYFMGKLARMNFAVIVAHSLGELKEKMRTRL